MNPLFPLPSPHQDISVNFTLPRFHFPHPLPHPPLEGEGTIGATPFTPPLKGEISLSSPFKGTSLYSSLFKGVYGPGACVIIV